MGGSGRRQNRWPLSQIGIMVGCAAALGLTAGVHLVIVQLLVVVRLLGVLAACQVQLADRGRAVAGGAGGVQGGGIPPWQCTPLPLPNRRPITTAPHQRELACPERAPALSLLPCE